MRRQAGYTLIEILVVVALIALIMSVGLPNFGMVIKANLSNSTRQLATTIRAAHDEAVLKGQVYRMAFDIDKQQYWVEQGGSDYLLRTSEQTEEEQRRAERRSKEDKEKNKDKDRFALASAVTKTKMSLPKGVKFTDIQGSRTKDPQKEGMAYAYVFPHGFIEKLTIHLKDGMDREATLMVNSVTGKSRLFERYVKDGEK